MLIGVARRKERQEHLVPAVEIIGDDVDAALGVVEYRAMMLPHPTRRAAGSAGVDQAGERIAPHGGIARRARRNIAAATALGADQLGPMVKARGVAWLAGANVLDADDILAFAAEQHRRDQRLGQFLV